MIRSALGSSMMVVAVASAHAQQPDPPRQTEADAYTRYELLAPGSAKSRPRRPAPGTITIRSAKAASRAMSASLTGQRARR